MISLSTARQLKEAGLAWKPAVNDFFIIPERGLDERIFVISEMPVNIEGMQGHPVFTFQGATEWALDYILTTEAVWLPSETQLREALTRRLRAELEPMLRLIGLAETCRCEIQFLGRSLSFEAPEASEAYGAALLHVLRHQP